MRILIIEDDSGIVRFLERGLGAHGHQILSADTGEDGVLLATHETVDLVLLDISLPGLDGHAVLAQIRTLHPNLPVLMLTARDDLRNKVDALNEGADDYLTKPFAFEELLARIHALLRRTGQQQGAKIRAGDLEADLMAHRIRRGGQIIELSSREFALLEYFMRHPGQVLSRQQILSAVWDYTFDSESNVVDVYVRYLRNKIDYPGAVSLITTIRGVGYRFDSPPNV